MIGNWAPTAVDIHRAIAAAAETGVLLELNAQPDQARRGWREPRPHREHALAGRAAPAASEMIAMPDHRAAMAPVSSRLLSRLEGVPGEVLPQRGDLPRECPGDVSDLAGADVLDQQMDHGAEHVDRVQPRIGHQRLLDGADDRTASDRGGARGHSPVRGAWRPRSGRAARRLMVRRALRGGPHRRGVMTLHGSSRLAAVCVDPTPALSERARRP